MRIFLEASHHGLTCLWGGVAIQKRHLVTEGFLQVRLEQAAHRCKLREDQRTFIYGVYLLKHLDETRQLTGSVRDGTPISEKLGRVVADLLQLEQRGQDNTAALDPRRLRNACKRVTHYGTIERSLLLRERTEDLDLIFGREVADDVRVGFEASQDEWSHQRLEALGSLGVLHALDRACEMGLKVGLRAEVARVEELENAPQLGQPILDGRAGEDDALACAQAPRRLGLARIGVFDVLGLVQNDMAPFDSCEIRFIAMQQRIGTDDQIVPGCRN